MDTAAPAFAAPEGSASLEAVLQVQGVAELLMLQLARCGDASDLGRAACVCKALRAASAAEAAWRVACPARFCTAAAVHASLQGAAASSFSWHAHFLERVQRPWTTSDARVCTAVLNDMALLIVDVWHGGLLVFSATLSPKADEMLDDECYSDSDDFDADIEWKGNFAIENHIMEWERYRRGKPAFVDAGRLRASAWLLRRADGRMVRVMSRTPVELDTVAEESVAWAGSRRFVFRDGQKPDLNIILRLGGWLVEEKTSYRWWPIMSTPRPERHEPRQLTRLSVRWQRAPQ